MIVVTGGEGFIGKNLIIELQRRGSIGIVVLDTKNESLDSIYKWLVEHAPEIDVIYHLGAITDTTVMDRNLFDEYNVNASVFIWNLCSTHGIPLVYASSAATYGDGEEGFDDEKNILSFGVDAPRDRRAGRTGCRLFHFGLPGSWHECRWPHGAAGFSP